MEPVAPNKLSGPTIGVTVLFSRTLRSPLVQMAQLLHTSALPRSYIPVFSPPLTRHARVLNAARYVGGGQAQKSHLGATRNLSR